MPCPIHRDCEGRARPPSAGWQCPNCGRAHAPSVQTCPEPASAVRDTLRIIMQKPVRLSSPKKTYEPEGV